MFADSLKINLHMTVQNLQQNKYMNINKEKGKRPSTYQRMNNTLFATA